MKLSSNLVLVLNFLIIVNQTNADDKFLVKNGQAKAEIIITEKPQRTTQLAAVELQHYIEKITGAKLPIVNKPSDDFPIKIFIGQSIHTDRLKIATKDLKNGSYRIVSGDNWLTLIGDDTNFAPIEPWPRSNRDIASGKMQQAWNKITGHQWGYPLSQLHKHYSGSNALFGTPKEQIVDKEGNVNVWTYDERGSFNAVCGYLRSLGVRWYMPGDVGEIVPKRKSIPLPKIDQVVKPDFPMRILNFRASVYGRDVMMWGYRLGVRQPYGRQAAHGLHKMTHNEQTLKNHPDWFALYGGKRHTQLGQRLNQLCYSNEELFKQTVHFARKQFDHFDFDVVSIMPPDGYTAMCQCELCKGKDSLDRGSRGMLSDYVWDFVNRVAKEVRKTHPDKMISNCAYGVYTLPPQNIDKLEPNVQVIIVGGRRPTNEDRAALRQLREAWVKKTDNPVVIFENYPFTGRGFYLPAYIPQVLGESINATKGISKGEDIWLTMDFDKDAIGYNHFLIYFTARMYWGGKKQDVVKMFEEYCRLFYGPAADEMKAFFNYCEKHWRAMEKDKVKVDHALKLFASAKAKAPDDSVYAKRIALIDNYLNGLRNKRVQLAQKRGPVPRLRLVGRSRGTIKIDGDLSDDAWQSCPTASTGRMSELQTGRQPTFGTSFKTAWIGNDLYFAIRCEEKPGEKLNIATTRNGDQAIWYGDVIEILLETESHSYYQIAVNPAGALVDLDRGAPKSQWFSWSSKAEVATKVAKDHWTVEIRIPITQDKNDPLHQVIGRRPTQSLPWHVNLCRQRIRKNGSELSAFSPTGASNFHRVMKFAHFYGGRSHQFEADPSVSDYLIASRKAENLQRRRKHQEAIAALTTLAKSKLTDLQKSDALEKAAISARALRNFEQVNQLAKKIPIKAVANTVLMHNLLAQRKAKELIEAFGKIDLQEWPFWQAGDAHFARGRAYLMTKNGKQAEADLRAALQLTPDSRTRVSILLARGNNFETNLNDDDSALKVYQDIASQKGNNGSADYYRAIQGAARLLTKKGEFEKAIKHLKLVNVDELRGYWRGSLFRSLGDTLRIANRKQEALTAYRKALERKGISDADRKAIEQAIESIMK